jgi:simple sugar transport system permease protein
LFASMLRYATPLIFGALGGMFSERSGVVNVGLEGMMLMGAFFGIMAADKLDSWFLGLVVGILSGGAMGLLHAIWSVHLRADQIISGFAINFLALGLTGYLFIDIYGQEGTPTDIPSIPNVRLAFLDGVPFIGDIFGNLNLMIWIALILVPLSWLVLFKTPLGLRIRAVGEHPRAADTVGIDVYRIRYGAVIASGMLAAAGGAFLSIGFVNSFNENMTAGRGFIALAAVIFGNWRPFGAAAACLLFGFSSALAQRLPEYSDSAAVLFQALPYVLTLIAVAGVIGRSVPPAADGRPYQKQ